MDVFSEIIFISDYIEMGRTHESCVTLRQELLSGISFDKSYDENLLLLKRSVFKCLDNTVSFVQSKNGFVHPKSILARNAYSSFN